MRYALVSDIHSNKPAWKAVLADLSSMGAQRIVCLGDVVGYGPEPVAVLDSLYRHVDAFVMGNHDAVVCGKLTPDRFNHQARFMIEWSTEQISRKGKEFLGSAALTLKGEGFVCVHGDLGQPGAFNYIVDADDTLPTWEAAETPLVFVGHTHRAGMFVRGTSGVPHPLPPDDFIVEDGKRYIVNVGSVGYPRDGDPRASYCLYDTATRVVTFRRVPFDYEALRLAVREAGLDVALMPLLDRDPIRMRQPVREQLGFDPAVSRKQMVTGVTLSRDLQELQKSNRRWRKAAVGGTLLAALMAGVLAAYAINYAATSETTIPQTPIVAREAVVPSDLAGNLLPPLPIAMVEREVPGWRCTLSRPGSQRLSIGNDAASPAPHLVIVHDKRARLRLEAPEWILGGVVQGRLRASVRAYRGEDFIGTVRVVAVVDERASPGEEGLRERTVLNFDLPLRRATTWDETRRIMDIKKPAITVGTERLRYRIEAEFVGTLALADLSLVLVNE